MSLLFLVYHDEFLFHTENFTYLENKMESNFFRCYNKYQQSRKRRYYYEKRNFNDCCINGYGWHDE